MNPETFFDKFGLLADTPNGVQKLRELILQLAVQGKLVSQDPNDEPVAVLLEKIKAEKGKNAKKLKPLPPVSEGEIYFELPIGWQWIRFDDICSYIQRGKGPKYVEKSDIPVISQKCIQWDGFKLDRARFISPSALEKYNEERFLCTGDLLWNSTGTGTIGRVNAYVHEDNSYDKVVADSHVTVVRPILLNSRFIYCWIASPIIQNEIEEMASGTTNQIELNLSTIKNHLVPLAPLNEQRRIVAEVDQLMALCDELEARQQKKQETRLRLNSAALDKLLTAHEPAEFANHWQRVCDNFDLLYDNPETVGELRKSILQLAVQGKLVRQDENDEPAAVLLEKIRAEKERLDKDKKIRKPKPLSSNNIENPYELPANWKWTRLFDIGVINPRNKELDDIDASFVPMTLISETYSTPVSSERRLWGEIKTGFTHFAEEDVVLAKITPCFQNGKSAVMRGLLNGFGAGTTELHVFRPLLGESVNPDYVLLYLKSPQFLTEGIENMTGTAGQKRVPRDYFAGNPFPLPPFEEQRRIVAKVDQLMALCDDLESKLNQSQTDGAKLMGAVVAEMVGA